jgi:hypothetical protein
VFALGTSFNVTANCPIGKIILAGGGQVKTTANHGSMELTASIPSQGEGPQPPGPSGGWTAQGQNNQVITAPDTVTITAWAMCSYP